MSDWEPHRRLLTVVEAAASIGRPASTLRRWISEGRLRRHAMRGHQGLYLEIDVLTAEAADKRRRATTNPEEHS